MEMKESGNDEKEAPSERDKPVMGGDQNAS
jgi:hypothetical protein